MKITKKTLKRIVLEEYAKIHGLKLRRKSAKKKTLKESPKKKKYTKKQLLEIKKLTQRLKRLIK